MSDELKAAAERARYLIDSPGWQSDNRETLLILARDCLSQHLADDDEPITAEWLESVDLYTEKRLEESVLEFECFGESEYAAQVWPQGENPADSLVILKTCRTRGSVRRLCRELTGEDT